MMQHIATLPNKLVSGVQANLDYVADAQSKTVQVHSCWLLAVDCMMPGSCCQAYLLLPFCSQSKACLLCEFG